MFGKHLKNHRQQLRLSQDRMAEKLCMDQSTYCRLEHTAHPKPHMVVRVSKALGIDATLWLDPADQPREVQGAGHVVPMRAMRTNATEVADPTWRGEAIKLLGRITDLLADLLQKNTRGTGV